MIGVELLYVTLTYPQPDPPLTLMVLPLTPAIVPVRFAEELELLPSVTCVAVNEVAQLPVPVKVTGVPAVTLSPLYDHCVELSVDTLT